MALRNRAAQTETFPFWVKRWRAYLGVTQKRFAELWGVSPSMVQKIESNDYGVGQLSFDRLESLRALLQMEPATFYGIVSENDPDGAERVQEIVSVRKLGAELATSDSVSLPTAWIEDYPTDSLVALELSERTFATDRLRYTLSPTSLIVVKEDTAPRPLDTVVGTKMLWDELQLLLFKYSAADTPLFLRPFNPLDERALECLPAEINLLGVCIGYWSRLKTP